MDKIFENFTIPYEHISIGYIAIGSAWAIGWLIVSFLQLIYRSDSKWMFLGYALFQINLIALIYGLNCKNLWVSKINLEPIFPIYNVVVHALACILAMVMISEWCQKSDWYTPVQKFRQTVIILALIAITIGFFSPKYAMNGLYLLGGLSVGIIAISIVQLYKYDRLTAILFSCGWGILLINTIFYVLANLQITPHWVLSKYGLFIGSAIEMFMMGYALIIISQKEVKHLSYILHDLGSPLLALEQMVEAIEKNPSESIDLKSLNRISGIIVVLRDISRRKSANDSFRPIKIKTLLCLIENQCLSMLSSNNIQFKSDLTGAGNETVHCNPLKITRAVTNLIKNSIEAVKNLDSPMIELGMSLHNKHFIIAVEDSGVKVSSKVASTMFIHGVTSKQGNSGYGLAMVTEVVKYHKGNIYIDEYCENMRIIIKLPIY